MTSSKTGMRKNRLGFYYYPDDQHYTDSDLRIWLPILRRLGASWLTLIASANRAIPEHFIKGLIENGIEPVLHFKLPFNPFLTKDSIQLLLKSYKKWGINYVTFFDRPNIRSSWQANSWIQDDLVERFLDMYLPMAEVSTNIGLKPVFPPLRPGGDYWDTAFLRAALSSLQRRGYTQLLKSIAIGAYAWADDHPLSWGAGGPERWPGVRPYNTPNGQEDQRGFYIFDWYQSICQSVLGESRPILLIGAGKRLAKNNSTDTADSHFNLATEVNLNIVKLALSESNITSDSGVLPVMPPEVIACNFWVLASSSQSSYANQSWFREDGSYLPIVDEIIKWVSENESVDNPSPPRKTDSFDRALITTGNGCISHYLLLPQYEWGIAEWHLEVVRPYILKHQPTIGFSIEEAANAKKVTVIGGEQSFSEENLDRLRQNGCVVNRVCGDGTSIATQLAKL